MTEEENYRLYYRLPSDRFQEIMHFGWFAYWYGHQYGNTLDLHFLEHKENLGAVVSGICEALLRDKNESFLEVRKNPPAQGIFDPESLNDIESNNCVFFSKDTKDLVTHLANNEFAPESVREALKLYTQEGRKVIYSSYHSMECGLCHADGKHGIVNFKQFKIVRDSGLLCPYTVERVGVCDSCQQNITSVEGFWP